MAEELPLALDGVLLGSVSVVDHAHGPLSLLPASSVETRLPFLCQHCSVLLLETHAKTVYPYGSSKATDSSG